MTTHSTTTPLVLIWNTLFVLNCKKVKLRLATTLTKSSICLHEFKLKSGISIKGILS